MGINKKQFNSNKIGLFGLATALLLFLSSCTFLQTSSTDTSVQLTQMELSIQQTLMAQNATQNALAQQQLKFTEVYQN